MQKDLKKKIVKVLLVGALAIVPLFPYHIYADTISQSDIQGVERVLVNSTYLDQTVTNSGNTYKYYSFDYEVTVLLKDYYLGWIQGTFQTSFKTFDNANWQVQNSSCTTVSKSYYVNDNKFKSSFTITAWVLVNQQGNVDPAGSYNTSFTLSNSNIVAYQDLNSIETVIDLLQDVNQYVSIDVLNELQNIVTNTSLSNTYLETISKLRQWHFPVESLTFNYQLFKKGYEVVDVVQFNYWEYPIFKFPIPQNYYDGISLYYTTTQDRFDQYIIIGVNKVISDVNTFNQYFSAYRCNAIAVEQLYRIPNNIQFSIIKVTLHGTEAGNVFLNPVVNDLQIIGIYNHYVSKEFNPYNISTDFALNYGLTNSFLDNIQIIAQGTQQSNSSSSELEDSADDIVQNSNTMFNFENQQNTNMNNALQSINTNFDIGNIGSSFLSSATWVKTQFDNLTNTTPFGSVLSFSLLLGLALLIIGKVYK